MNQNLADVLTISQLQRYGIYETIENAKQGIIPESLRRKEDRPSGVILWRGPSKIDGKPIVVVAVGLRVESANKKTGAMIQVYIMREDVHPWNAIDSGEDVSICGGCIHRKRNDEEDGARTCFVQSNPLTSVWSGLQRDIYPMIQTNNDYWALFVGRKIRWGFYGDPALIPLPIVAFLSEVCEGRTGYTHQWREPWAQPYARYLMASCETARDAALAVSMGWRFFLATMSDSEIEQAPRAINCPASAEAGFRSNCLNCSACDGAGDNPDRVSIQIRIHGGAAIMANARRKFGE